MNVQKELGKLIIKLLPALIKLVLSNETTTKIEAIIEIASNFNITELVKETIDSLNLVNND